MVRFKSYSATPGESELSSHMVARMGELRMQAELTWLISWTRSVSTCWH